MVETRRSSAAAAEKRMSPSPSSSFVPSRSAPRRSPRGHRRRPCPAGPRRILWRERHPRGAPARSMTRQRSHRKIKESISRLPLLQRVQSGGRSRSNSNPQCHGRSCSRSAHREFKAEEGAGATATRSAMGEAALRVLTGVVT
ncbi:hypothetical protein ZEAMMB73_Zm00001d004603 [Zea mays]|uniref:Uncharacterized protein n=1 Tax=Zea mays TaxID=4577 RepID=A0A1D6EGH7_MAIZE|nr:hypothetical protein ZEAMMB73_Zm00001d004603 [Zea mays]